MKSRIDEPGALHHIIGRGIDRRAIFCDNTDYHDFLKRLGELLIESGARFFAWALIPNHFHLLLRTGDISISAFMKRLLTGYAVNYNRRHGRVGHLFQNRYKSILCQENSYLLELVRYIHLNPLRAKLVVDYQELGAYPYCGHGVILGQRPNIFQDRTYVLRLFDEIEAEATRKYGEFVCSGIARGRQPELTDGGLVRSHGGWVGLKVKQREGDYQKGDQRILGDGAFVEEVLVKAEERMQKKYQIRAAGYDFDTLLMLVSEITGIDPEQIQDTQRDSARTQARSILCYWAADQLGLSQVQLARMLNQTQPAISYAVRRGKALVEKNGYAMS